VLTSSVLRINLSSMCRYAWSMSLVQVPMSVVETLIFSVLAYFMIGFSTGTFTSSIVVLICRFECRYLSTLFAAGLLNCSAYTPFLSDTPALAPCSVGNVLVFICCLPSSCIGWNCRTLAACAREQLCSGKVGEMVICLR
jgi:hypothetical protein